MIYNYINGSTLLADLELYLSEEVLILVDIEEDDEITGKVYEELAFNRIRRNVDNFVPKTTKRQYATQPIQIAQMQYIPATKQASGGDRSTLTIKGVARNFQSGKKYDPVIRFNQVIFEKEDSPTNITFVANSGEKYHILPIDLTRNTVRCSCNCLDFYWRFSTQNKRQDVLYGNRYVRRYVKKTNRPPVNPQHVSGACKHILKLVEALRHAGVVKN